MSHRHLWTFFVIGLFGAAVLSTVLSDSRASGDKDERIRKIEDTSISGVKTEVPLVAEMEKGILDREAEIEERERRVRESEERIRVEESRVKTRIDELQALLDQISEKRGENQKVGGEVLKRLVKTFESMAPKKASGVLSVMEDVLAIEILSAMKEKKVAQIMDVMDPNKAMSLSSLIAKRRPAGAAIGEEQPQRK